MRGIEQISVPMLIGKGKGRGIVVLETWLWVHVQYVVRIRSIVMIWSGLRGRVDLLKRAGDLIGTIPRGLWSLFPTGGAGKLMWR